MTSHQNHLAQSNGNKLIKLLIFLFFILSLAYAQEFPKPVGFVNDFANIISSKIQHKLDLILREIKKKTGIEIAVVTINSTKPLDINMYAVLLFEKWGIGEKEKDNGVLILVSKKDRKIRIEVGYGLEGILPDGLCGEIIRKNIIPFFKEKRFGEGLLSGVLRIRDIISKEYNVKFSKYPKEKPYTKSQRGGSIIGFLIPLILLTFFFGGRFGLFPILFFPSGGSFWGSRGFGGGSSFGGGVGGFGGGTSGGGGATGSW